MSRMLIVGGGLTGSLLAVFLARRGYFVDVFERFSDARADQDVRRPALSITLCERGLQALGEVGLRDAVLSLAVPARGRKIHALDGSLTYQPYGNHGEAIYSISRADLNQALLDFACTQPRVAFHFDEKCIRLDPESATAHFENVRTGLTTQVQGDRVFGTDGAYSTIRAHLQKREHFNYSQEYWRFGGYKSLWIPARADGSPALEGEALHIWPRGSRMLMGFPNVNGGAMLSLLLPWTGEDSFESIVGEAGLLSYFRRSFPDIAESIPSLVEQFFARQANSLLTVRCDPWSYADKVLLLGDAAHAILPSFGQGANAGFEDCSVLGRCLSKHGDDWLAAFQDFEQRRRPSMDIMSKLCIEHFVELSDLVGDARFLQRREVERRLEEEHPQLYRSLYSMVSFSCIPYAEAYAVEQTQRAAVDGIMALDDEEKRFDPAEVNRIFKQAAETSVPAELVARDQDADPIFKLGLAFWGAKALLSAVELGLFATLSEGPRSKESLTAELGLHPRGVADFLDALTALGLLTRSAAGYANSSQAQELLVPHSPSYVGGALALANERLYPVWGKLTDALKTGEPQNEAQREKDYYDSLGREPERLRKFLQGMSGLSLQSARAMAAKFPWSKYRSFADLGGAQGVLPAQVALAHPHLVGVNFDLPPVKPIFEEYAESLGLSSRVRFQGGDFFADPLPAVDVVIMGHVLHNWSLAHKQLLISRAFEALPRGGALVVYEALLDDERTKRAFGLLMSLNMLLVTTGGFVFSGADCMSWMREAGFSRSYVEHLHGADWMVVAIK